LAGQGFEFPIVQEALAFGERSTWFWKIDGVSETDRLRTCQVANGAFRIAKQVTAERFGPDKKVQKDMLGSFVAHGLTQKEAESEILLQM
jgi:hypothetical protein